MLLFCGGSRFAARARVEGLGSPIRCIPGALPDRRVGAGSAAGCPVSAEVMRVRYGARPADPAPVQPSRQSGSAERNVRRLRVVGSRAAV